MGAGSYKTGAMATAYRRAVTAILALVAFSFVSSGTPGPNNVMLWASGASFGFRRTVPHIVGTAVGIGIMTLAAAAGLAALISALPGLAFVMKLAGSAYLLYLAWQVAHAGAIEAGVLARPMGLGSAAAFQVVNPKAWIFALGAVTTFRPAELSPLAGTALVALVMAAVILPTASIWAAAGGVIGRLVTSPRTRTAVSLVLAAMVVASVALVWI
jgi:threonine/homoserine/homoserine lactone efflux protein